MTYLVIMPSCSEFRTSEIKEFKTKGELLHWIMHTNKDLNRLKIYEAKQLTINLELGEKS